MSERFSWRGLAGPALVMVGASMWGLESYWRLELSKVLDADVLVFHEHWLGLLLTSPFLIAGARRLRRVRAHAWWSMVLSGVLGSALGTVAFTKALTLLNPSIANLLLNVQPLVSVVVSWFWLGERPGSRFYPWAAAALLCGLVLAWPSHTTATGRPIGYFSPAEVAIAFGESQLGLGLLLIGATAFCWGASTTFGRGAMLDIDFRTGVALRYLIGTVATFGVVLVRGASPRRLNFAGLFTAHALRDMAMLLVVAALTPTFLYFAGLARTRASVATFAEMGQTLAALLITWGVMGWALTPVQLVAGALLLVAVNFIHRSMDELPGAAAPEPVPHPE